MKGRTPDEQRRIDAAIARLAVAWRVGIDQETMAVYAQVFDGLTVDEVERGCWEAMRSGLEYMPAAGSIRQGILLDRQRRRFVPQWERPEFEAKNLPASREEAAHWIEQIRRRLGRRAATVGKGFPRG